MKEQWEEEFDKLSKKLFLDNEGLVEYDGVLARPSIHVKDFIKKLLVSKGAIY